MGSLVPYESGDPRIVGGGGGELARYDPQAEIAMQVTDNFARRGEMAAQLVVAALTETPYTYMAGDREISLAPLDRPWMPEDLPPRDTVEEARVALDGFLTADVPGSARLRLDSYATKYRKIARELWPGWTDARRYTDAFATHLVEQAGYLGVQLEDSAQARDIIRRAPTSVKGLRMSDHRDHSYSDTVHKLITVDGRQIVVDGSYSYNWGVRYGLTTDSDKLVSRRGGRAPDFSIVDRIRTRAVDLRTHNSRA